MAIDANSYCAITDLERRISDLLVGGVFHATTTRPTLAQAEQMIDDVAAEMNSVLEASGYAVPIVLGTDAFAFNYAMAANSAGAAVKVMSIFPSEAWDPNAPEPTRNRVSAFASEYKKWLDRVEAGKIKASRDIKVTANFIVGSARDRQTGELKTPVFTRNSDRYPGRPNDGFDGTQ
jgi:hypothetical protein